MRRKKLASGVMMLALLGFAAERSLAGEPVVDQEQEVSAGQEQEVIVDQGQGEVIVDQEQGVAAEQSQDVIIDQGQDTVVVDQEQEVAAGQEQEVIIDPKKGGYHPPIGQCKASNPPVNGQCPSPPPHLPCKKQDELTPIIQTGECWSQCIYPGRMGKTYKPVKTCKDCKQVVPNGTQIIPKKVVVKIVTPGELQTQCRLKPSGKYEWRKVADAQYGTVTIQDCKAHTTPLVPVCHTEPRSVQVTYEIPTISTDIITHPISFPYNWEDLYRKDTPCPPNGKGGTDCSAVCNEPRTGTQKVEIEKCLDKVGTRLVSITRHYNVTVCEPPKNPPPPICQTREKSVMIKPPQYERVEIMEKACYNHVVIGKPHHIDGTVTFHVPRYNVTPKPPVIDCIGVPTQVCKPVLVWRQEAMCLNDGKNHSGLIIQVQEALVQAGFDAGQADGVLNDKTKQAIVEFQKAKGLAQGGTLTKETVEALGISL